MKKINIEQRIINAKPEHEVGKPDFVKSTMQAIKSKSTNETFSNLLRKTNVTKKGAFKMKYEKLKWRFNQLPSYVAALIILGSFSTVGAAAYAAYHWIYPKVSITNIQQSNDDNKRQYTVDSQCGEFYSGQDLKYEVAQESGLNDQDVRKVFENTCAYNALQSFIDSRWKSDNDQESFAKKKVGDIVTIYESSSLFSGSDKANPAFGVNIGKVVSIDQKEIKIELPIYSIETLEFGEGQTPFKYFPEGKIVSRTLPLANEVEVLADGKVLNLDDVKVGDMVQTVTRTQNKVQYYEDIKQTSLGEQVTFDTVGIIKTDIDTRYVSNAASQIGDPAIINAIAGLGPCHNNEQYLCVFVPNQIIGSVYSTIDEQDTDNLNKYLRKDFNDESKVKALQLDGRVVDISGKVITLQTRGTKAKFTIELPYDAVAEYNKPKPVKTDLDKSKSLKLEVGDLINVIYVQADGENHLQIKPADLQGVFVVEQIQPDGSLAKY